MTDNGFHERDSDNLKEDIKFFFEDYLNTEDDEIQTHIHKYIHTIHTYTIGNSRVIDKLERFSGKQIIKSKLTCLYALFIQSVLYTYK